MTLQVYAFNPDSLPGLEAGFTFEVCAGLIDKDKPILEICREEVLFRWAQLRIGLYGPFCSSKRQGHRRTH